MVKGKYLIIFFILVKPSAEIGASAWPLKQGKLLTIGSIEISNTLDKKVINTVKEYYKNQRLINLLEEAHAICRNSRKLEADKEKLEQDYKRVKARIDKAKLKQKRFDSYYSTLKFYQYLEYGFRDYLSLYGKFSAHWKENNIGYKNLNNQPTELLINNIQLGSKYNIISGPKGAISLLGGVELWQNGNVSTELKIALGRVKESKRYQWIRNFEFGVNIPVINKAAKNHDNKLYFLANYTTIRKSKKYGFMVMLQNLFNYYPAEYKSKAISLRIQTSFVKNLTFSNQDYNFALQLGYYYDVISRSRYLRDQGVILSIWKEF